MLLAHNANSWRLVCLESEKLNLKRANAALCEMNRDSKLQKELGWFYKAWFLERSKVNFLNQRVENALSPRELKSQVPQVALGFR